MSFDSMCADMATVHFDVFGQPAIFMPQAGDPVETRVIFDIEGRSNRDQRDLTAGHLAQVIDRRPSVELPKAVVGHSRGGKVRIGDRIWVIDAPISDDGYGVRFFVK